MSRKIIGVTVGTPLDPQSFIEQREYDELNNKIGSELKYIPIDSSSVQDGAPVSFKIGDTLTFGTQTYWCHLKMSVQPRERYRLKHRINDKTAHYFVLLIDESDKILYRYAAGGANGIIVTDITIPDDNNIAYMQAIAYDNKKNTDKLMLWKVEDINPLSYIEKNMMLYHYVTPEFEIGNINITADGWVYGNRNNRIRTPQGYTIPLKKGDVVGLTDYTDARFFLGWLRADETYGFKGWLTEDYVITEDGEYVILMSNLTEVIQYGLTLSNLLFIRCGNLDKTIKELQKNSYPLTDLFARKKCHTIAHGGHTAQGQVEHTKSSFIASAKSGVWALETDIMQTSDGKYICCHDVYVDDVTTSTGLVSSYTLEELQNMTLKVRGTDKTLEEKFCTLEEFLDICMIYGCVPVVELKVKTSYNGETVNPQYDYEYIVNAIKQRGLERTSIVISFYWDRLQGIRNYSSNIHVLLICSASEHPSQNGQYNSIMSDENSGFDVAEANACLTREWIDSMRALGKTVFTWTSYNDRTNAIKNRDIGVNGITSAGIVDVLQL